MASSERNVASITHTFCFENESGMTLQVSPKIAITKRRRWGDAACKLSKEKSVIGKRQTRGFWQSPEWTYCSRTSKQKLSSLLAFWREKRTRTSPEQWRFGGSSSKKESSKAVPQSGSICLVSNSLQPPQKYRAQIQQRFEIRSGMKTPTPLLSGMLLATTSGVEANVEAI